MPATGFEIFSLTPRGAPSSNDDSLALHFLNMQAGGPVDAQSFELSAAVYHSMLGHIQEFDRGIKRARFAVLRRTNIPSILVEGGFLSESGDSKRIADPAWRKQLALRGTQGLEGAKPGRKPKLDVRDHRIRELERRVAFLERELERGGTESHYPQPMLDRVEGL